MGVNFPPMMVPVSADDAAMRRVLAQAEARVDAFAARADGSLRRVESAFDRAGTVAGRLGGAIAGIGLAQTASEAIRAADAWNLATSKIALYAGAGEKAVAVQQQLFDVAQRSRSALEPTIGLYTSLADAMLGMGKGQSEVIRLTETIGKTFKISGTEAGAASGALVQLSQALGTGVLRGDEFNSVMEASPRLAKALADGLGVPRAALRALAEQGQLTADKVVGALLKQSSTIDAEFGRLAVTVGDSLTVMQNALQRQMGEFDRAYGVTRALSTGVIAAADNLDTLANGAIAAAAAVGSVYAARGLSAAIANGAQFVATQAAMRAELVSTTGHLFAKEAALRAGAAASVEAAAADVAAAQAAQAKARADLAVRATQYESALALDGAIGKTARLVQAEQALIAARNARVAADARVTETTVALTMAQGAQTSAIAGTGVAATVASRGMALLSGAMALVGGPVGAALLAGAAAIAFLATRTTSAERATTAFDAAQRSARDAVQGSAPDVEQLAKQYDRLSDSMKAVTRVKLSDALAEQAKAIAAQRAAASAAVYGASSPARPVTGSWNVSTDTASAPRVYEQMGLAAEQVDRLRTAFAAFRSAAADDPAAIADLVRVLDDIGSSAGAAGRPLQDLASKLSDPATKAQAAAKTAQEFAARLALLANPADAAAKAVLAASQTADTAASRFAGLGSAVGGVASKLAELSGKTWTLSLPPGLERRVGEMVGPPPEAKTQPVTGFSDRATSPDDVAYQQYEAGRNVARTVLQNRIVPAESAEAVRLLKLEADAQEKLGKARASAQPWAIKTAEVEVEVAKRLREGHDPARETDLRTQLLRKARAEFAGEVGAQVTQLDLDVAAQQRLTAAAGKGEAAQRAAAAANRVAAAGLKGYGDAAAAAEARVEALTVEQLRKDADQPIQDRIRSAKALISAYEQGPTAVKAAEVAEQAHTLALKEGEEGTQKYNEAKVHYIELLTQAQQLEAGAAAGPMLQQQRDQLDLGQKQLQLMGASAEVRAVELARTQALIDLREKNIDASSREGQTYLANAEALAKQNLGLERASSAYQELEQFGDRSFDAILQKLSAAGKSTMSWADAVSTVTVELQQLALKMALINPLKNLVMGSNLPTVFDFFGGGSSAQAGQGSGITGSLTNTALSKGAGWAMDKLIPGGLSSAIDSFGYSTLGIGTIGGWAASAPATVTAATAVPISGAVSANAATGIAAAGNTAAANTLYSGAASGVSGAGVAGGLSAYLGAAGAGAFGGMGGAYLGTLTNSKVVGGLSGAALGAGASALAAYMGLGAIGGPIGLAIGAVVGGIMGMLGTQKATVGPNSSGNIVLNGKGGFRTDTALADNGADAGQMQQVTDAIAASMNTIVSGIGGKLTGGDGANTALIQQFAKDGKWYVTPKVGDRAGERVAFTDQNEAIAFYMRESLRGLIGNGQLTGVNDDVKKALTTSKATKAEDLANDLGFAAGFRQQLDVMNASLDPTNNLLKTFTDNAKSIGEAVKTNITDWRSKASELGLATESELTSAARKGIEAMMGLGPATKPLVGMAAATKQAEIEFEQFRPALLSLGYTTSQVADLAARYTKKLQDAYTEAVAYVQRQGAVAIESLIDPTAKSSALDRLQGLGLDRKDSAIVGLASVIDGVEQAAAGGTLTIEGERTALGRLNSALYDGTITGDQYTTIVGYLTQAWSDSADAAERAAKRTAYATDITARMYSAVGADRSAGLIRLDAQQATELREAKASGYDLTQLRLVQGAERAATAFQLAQQDLLDGYDREIEAKQRVVDSIQSGAIALLKVAQQFQDARAALREGDDSPLAPRQKMQEASDRFEAAYRKLHDDSATDAEKEAARQTLLQVGPALVAMEKAASGGTASALFERVDTVFGELGDTSGLSLDTAQMQLETAQDELKELQQARADAAALGQRQLGSLSGMRDVLDQSYAVWQAALEPLKALTGTPNQTPHYAAPANVQAGWDSLSAEQQHGIARAMGWGGDVDGAFNIWLATDAGRAATFGGDVLSIAGGTRYGAAADVQAAWDALSEAQRLAAVRAAGYDGGIDAGLNAWAALGHGEALANAVRAQARTAGLPGYALGGISTGPQLAWVSEGAYAAEAHVPLPDGRRIPVALSMSLPVNDLAPPSPTVAFRRPSLDGGEAGVAELLEEVRQLRADLRATGQDALTQRARIGGDAATLLARVEAATLDLPRKLANTRRAA